jgi:hypothetical protein
MGVMKKMITALLLLLATQLSAQTDSSYKPLTFSGYLEAYYSYDFSNPGNHNRPAFLYSYNRHNEINLNLGFVKAAYQSRMIRANLALGAGTYMNANMAAEPGVLKNIYEANAGVRLSKKKNLWLDAGIFASHIGFESAIGKDCWALTRSMSAENSPYYESGVKVSYTSDNGKWLLSGLVLNGWQRIQRVDGNNTPAFGHQLTFKPNAAITLNSSSFIGNDKPDSVKQMRYFHDLYGIFQLSKNFAITAGFDIGAEQTAKGSSNYNTWYTPILIFKFSPDAKNNIAARIEYYNDPNGVIISTNMPGGFETWCYSLNYDRLIYKSLLWRIDGRAFSGATDLFLKNDQPVNQNFCVTTSLAFSF